MKEREPMLLKQDRRLLLKLILGACLLPVAGRSLPLVSADADDETFLVIDGWVLLKKDIE